MISALVLHLASEHTVGILACVIAHVPQTTPIVILPLSASDDNGVPNPIVRAYICRCFGLQRVTIATFTITHTKCTFLWSYLILFWIRHARCV